MQGTNFKTNDMNKINFKNFCINNLDTLYKNKDIFFEAEEIKNSEAITIGEHLECSINKGSENIYFMLIVYKLNKFTPIELKAYTKEAHADLKKLIIEIINQS